MPRETTNDQLRVYETNGAALWVATREQIRRDSRYAASDPRHRELLLVCCQFNQHNG